VGPDSIEILENLSEGRLLDEVYGYRPGWGMPSAADAAALVQLMNATSEPEPPVEGPARG
jgi:glutamate synthase (ferredoxin)